jgi:hypothetical protein
MDDELLALARVEVGRQHGLSAAQSARLIGDSAAALHRDAAQMCRELGIVDLRERTRDRAGRYASSESDSRSINALIRAASGRTL